MLDILNDIFERLKRRGAFMFFWDCYRDVLGGCDRAFEEMQERGKIFVYLGLAMNGWGRKHRSFSLSSENDNI